jgi:uncharacterized OB-fold protein/acyl dehydratase
VTDESDLPGSTLLERLQAYVGKRSGPPVEGPDEVNQAMIRHFVEAVGDENPVYTDAAAANAAGFPGVIAPPPMLQAWIMRGYRASMDPKGRERSTIDEAMALLDSDGFTSVVATDCEQEYLRPVVLGDRISASSVIESISDMKKTALGEGHFVTTRLAFTDAGGEPIATMRFRILKFRPKRQTEQNPSDRIADGSKRPRPALTHDNSFFFEGAARGELLIQRCSSCGKLRHPPRPGCPYCRSLEWDTVTSTGRGTIFSFVVVNHPQAAGFEYPLPVVLVELEEGTRLISNVVGIAPEDLKIGTPVEIDFRTYAEDLTLPYFRPVAEGGS